MGFQECCCCHHNLEGNYEPRRPPAEIKIVGHCIHGNNFVTCVTCKQERQKTMANLNHPYSCCCKLCVGEREAAPFTLPVGVSGSMSFTPKIEATPYKDINAFLEECLETMRTKGHDYREGNDDDLLHNFRTVAEDMGMEMEQVWYIYASKHWKAIKTFIKSGGQSESEPIEGRIKDIIVYSLLLYRMVNKGKGPEPKKTATVYFSASSLTTQQGYPLMAEPLKEVKEPSAGSLGVPIKVGGRPNPLEIDPQKMYKLIGEPGKFISPAITQHAKEIINQLEEQEKSSLPPTEPGYFPEDYGRNPVLDIPSRPLTEQQLQDIKDVLEKEKFERDDFVKGEWPKP